VTTKSQSTIVQKKAKLQKEVKKVRFNPIVYSKMNVDKNAKTFIDKPLTRRQTDTTGVTPAMVKKCNG